MEHSNSHRPVRREILFLLRIIASIFNQNLRTVAHAVCHRLFTARGEGGFSPRAIVDREQRNIFFSPTYYVFCCHYSPGAPYTFRLNHRKQCAKSSNEALMRTVGHTFG